MDIDEMKQYEAMLIDLQSSIREEIEQAKDDTEPVALDGRMGRISRGDAMQVQQMALEMQRRREERLVRIKSALGRIEDGDYGLCGRCERPIGTARLHTFPEVVLCIHCASVRR